MRETSAFLPGVPADEGPDRRRVLDHLRSSTLRGGWSRPSVGDLDSHARSRRYSRRPGRLCGSGKNSAICSPPTDTVLLPAVRRRQAPSRPHRRGARHRPGPHDVLDCEIAVSAARRDRHAWHLAGSDHVHPVWASRRPGLMSRRTRDRSGDESNARTPDPALVGRVRGTTDGARRSAGYSGAGASGGRDQLDRRVRCGGQSVGETRSDASGEWSVQWDTRICSNGQQDSIRGRSVTTGRTWATRPSPSRSVTRRDAA